MNNQYILVKPQSIAALCDINFENEVIMPQKSFFKPIGLSFVNLRQKIGSPFFPNVLKSYFNMHQ